MVNVHSAVGGFKQGGLDATLQMANVAAGGAAHVIAEIADDAGADLIVAGTRGYGALSPGCCWAASRIACCTSRTARCWSPSEVGRCLYVVGVDSRSGCHSGRGLHERCCPLRVA
jgi:hypothetical protein